MASRTHAQEDEEEEDVDELKEQVGHPRAARSIDGAAHDGMASLGDRWLVEPALRR